MGRMAAGLGMPRAEDTPVSRAGSGADQGDPFGAAAERPTLTVAGGAHA